MENLPPDCFESSPDKDQKMFCVMFYLSSSAKFTGKVNTKLTGIPSILPAYHSGDDSTTRNASLEQEKSC